MKILFVAPQPFFRDRGTPIRTFHQIEALSEMENRVDVACYPFGENIGLPNVRLIRSARPPFIHDVKIGPSLAKFPLDACLMLKTIRLIARNRYDIVQAVEEAAFFCALLKPAFGFRFVYNMDSHLTDQLAFTGFFKEGPLLALARKLEANAMRRADYVVTVGSVLSDVVRHVAPATRVLQLEDAPNSDHFIEDAEGALRLRQQLGIGDMPVALYTGNFHVYQGIELLIRAAAIVAAKRPEIRIVIAGGSDDEIDKKRRMALDIGAGTACIFAGRRPTREMPAFMTMAQCVLSPRILGTNPPLKIYPYMQTKRVIVATDVSSHTQVLDRSCAILTPPEPEAYAEGILRAFADPEGASRLAEEAFRRLEEKYSLRVFREKVRRTYMEISSAVGRCG